MDRLTDAGVALTAATALFTARVVCEQTLSAAAAGQIDAARLLIARGALLEDRTLISRETTG